MTSSLDRAAPLRHSENAIASEVAGEIIITCIESGRYFGLDSIGSDIWQRLETPKSLDGLVAELEEIYDADRATIDHDTQVLIASLMDRGLVHYAA